MPLYAYTANAANDNQDRQQVIPNEWLIVNDKNANLCLDVSGWA